MSARPTGCGEDVAAYALGALDPVTARTFERHLDECDLCRTDLAMLQPAVASLPASAQPVDPPPELKKRIMAVVESEAKERRKRLADAPRSRWRMLAGAHLLPRAGLVAAAAAAVVIAVVMIGGGGGDDPASRELRAKTAPPGSNVVLRMDDGRGTLVVSGMDAPKTGRVYQVWKKRGTAAPEPTDALFTPTNDGHASVAVPGDMKGVDQVLVSTEPRGGSPAPTSAAAIVVDT